VYHLIEIESPHAPPFTKGGAPSARLTRALQQIRDWKQWIAENLSTIRSIFPSRHLHVTGEVHFAYSILIGRRGDTDHEHRRNFLAGNEGVAIRSFDFLSDLLAKRLFTTFTEPSSGLVPLDLERDNAFTNPFYRAYSDKQWRSIVERPQLETDHMVTNNIDSLLAQRTYNEDRLRLFLKYLDDLPEDRRRIHPEEYPSHHRPRAANPPVQPPGSARA
jgi:hypothetical protein